MGSTVAAAGAPLLNVNLFDPTNGTTTAVTKVMYGKPGTNVNAVQVYSATGTSFTWSDMGLANLTTGYYYLDITNGTSRAITAPIWYNRNDAVLPIKLQYFTAQKNALGAKLNWASATELNAKNYEVEKSTDGIHWKTMVTINANGNSSALNEYYTFDNFPVIGVNYYRLKQVDVNGKFEYSVVRTVVFTAETAIMVFPNPASGTINLYVKNKTDKTYAVSLMDISGRVVYKSISKEYKLAINAKNLVKGIYFVKVIAEGNVYSEKVIVE
jgi:trimeric autotransporter adhesin